MQIGLLEPDNFSQAARHKLETIGNVTEFRGESLNAFLAPLDVLFVRLGMHIGEELLTLAPRLRWLCSPTTGHNHLDEKALAARSVEVISLRGEREFLETIRATPEHTFGLILALLRHYRKAFEETLAGKWNRDSCRGEELYGNRVGIIGLGRVGSRVASYCSAFGAHVFWCDPAEVVSMPAWKCMPDIVSVIEASRIVVLCANFKDGDPPIIGPREIQKLENRYFVNTARGELVDEAALLTTIRNNRLAGVATDVVAGETGKNRLEEWRALAPDRNLILTPHIAGATVESMSKTELFIAEKLLKAIQKRRNGESR